MLRTSAENEAFVRERWVRVWINTRTLEPRIDDNFFLTWTEAAEFAEKRMEEIRQVEAEIDAVIYWLDNAVYKATPKRILAREKVALAELKRGMKW